MTTMSTRRALAATGAILATVMMVVLGCWQISSGIAALSGDPIFEDPGDYVAGVDLTTWGWSHLISGAAIAVAGAFVLTGRMWARVVGMFFAMVVTLLNFAFIPYYPFWAIACVAMGIGVIWALAEWDPRQAADPEPGADGR